MKSTKNIVIAVAVIAIIAGLAWYFVFRKKDDLNKQKVLIPPISPTIKDNQGRDLVSDLSNGLDADRVSAPVYTVPLNSNGMPYVAPDGSKFVINQPSNQPVATNTGARS